MYEKRRSASDKIHREKTVKSNTAFLQTERKEEISAKMMMQDAGQVTAEMENCTIMEGVEIRKEG